MNAGRRNAISLCADIVRGVGSGAKVERGRYLDELVGMGMITKTGSPPAWAVTERGREFVRKYEELGKLLEASP